MSQDDPIGALLGVPLGVAVAGALIAWGLLSSRVPDVTEAEREWAPGEYRAMLTQGR